MTEIALPSNPRTTDLEAWLLAASQTHQVAVGLAKTSFVPTSMKGRPEEITAAILAGQEIGLQPMSALRSIDIIDGTPALRAVALRGLVQSHGHQIWVKESTATRATVCGQRHGETNIQTSTWTIERARQAGLAGKKNWQNHPSAMLVARATAEVARLVAADVILGMPYTIEEIQDGVIHNIETGHAEPVGPVEVHTPTTRMRRSAWQRADEQHGVPEPPIEADNSAVTDPDDTVWPAPADVAS